MNLENSIGFKYRKFWFFLYSIVQWRNEIADEIGQNSWLFGEFWSETKFVRHFGEFSSQLLFGFIRNFADWFTEDFRGSRNSERKFAPPVDPRETFQRNFRFTLHAKLVVVKATYFTTKHMEFPLWSSLHANCNRSNLVISIVSMRFSIWSIFLNIHMYSC